MSVPQATDVIENMPAMDVDLTVVVPACNEERRLAPMLDAIARICARTRGTGASGS